MKGGGGRRACRPGKREQGTVGQDDEPGHFSMYYFHSADHISGAGEGGQNGAGDGWAKCRAGSFLETTHEGGGVGEG